MPTTYDRWSDVRDALDEAEAVCFDGCHKIYVLLDQQQVDEFTSFGYEPVPVEPDNRDEVLELLKRWYDQSCFLKFVNSVRSHPSNPNLGYTTLIEQGAEDDD